MQSTLLTKTLLMRCAGVACVAMACALATPAWAQADEIESSFRRMDPAEESKLRAVLAEPVPQGGLSNALGKHFAAKDNAAVRLGDTSARIALLRDAIKLLPDAVYKSNLASELMSKGDFEEANVLRQQAIVSAIPEHGAFFAALYACDLVEQNKYTLARQAFDDVKARASALSLGSVSPLQRGIMQRSLGRAARCESDLEGRLGKDIPAIAAAELAETYNRQALALLSRNSEIAYIQVDVASSIARRLQAYRAAGRLQDAEKALADYIAYAREVALPPSLLSGIYSTAANLRFSQREFAASVQLLRKSDEVLEKLKFEPLNLARVNRARSLITSLIGQKKWPEALQELERLDSLAGDNAQLKARVVLRFERALTYFSAKRFAQAAPLFAAQAQANLTVYGPGHFFVAQASGLQGAALWRSALPENQAKALPLLKAAVRDYMAPANADYIDNTGLRKDVQEMVFAAYLDAVSSTPGENATQAIGPADWARSSIVQDALGDAAARASAGTPALSQVVRNEQDAKNEIAGLRRSLANEGGADRAPSAAVATQMRARITELGTLRTALQAQIKAQFPDYARLVRPEAPDAVAIARQLGASQALVMLLPTADAVYVWAVASDRPASFARVALPESALNAMVARLRKNLDLTGLTVAPTEYDSATAYSLYQQLLAPVASAWQGKGQLIVAAAGSLSQLPFGVLHTAPGGTVSDKAPWLIAQTAITQVPSISAWLAIKTIAKSQSAPEPFIGWGDPVFAYSAASSAAASATQKVPAAPAVRDVALLRTSAVADLDTALPSTAPGLRYGDIPPLPDTRVELQAIAKILAASPQSDVILGASATRESVLAASASGLLARKRVIAFATHGLMAGDLPNLTQPALAMAATAAASTQPLSPLLTLEDVLTLKLNADWVVLSACNTAAADGRAEEALSGLARGFFYAGGRSLLVTHWAVESVSAQQLTNAIFAHTTANPQAPKAESLRQAMLKIMRTPGYAHPAFWAPYALVGVDIAKRDFGRK
jgi:CHAT domain-containing protein